MGYFAIAPAHTGLTMPATSGMHKMQQINCQPQEQGVVPSGKPCSVWIYDLHGGTRCHLPSPSPAKQPAQGVQNRPLAWSVQGALHQAGCWVGSVTEAESVLLGKDVKWVMCHVKRGQTLQSIV